MTSEPFRYTDQQPILDVAELNPTSGLKSSSTPLSTSYKLALSADMVPTDGPLNKSSEGSAPSYELFSSSAEGLMASHNRAKHSSLLRDSLTTPNINQIPTMTGSQNASFLQTSSIPSTSVSSSILLKADPFPPPSHSATPSNGNTNIIQPIISPHSNSFLPPSVSNMTIKDAIALGEPHEALRVAQQAAIQSSSMSPFNSASFLASSNIQAPAPTMTSSGNLRYSGDRFAPSAFSPVAAISSSKTPNPSFGSNGHVLTPLPPHPTSFSPNFMTQSGSTGNPFTLSSQFGPNSMAFESLAKASSDFLTNSGFASSNIATASPSSTSTNPLKRPYLGPSITPNTDGSKSPFVVSQRSTDSSSSTTEIPTNGFFNESEMRGSSLLSSMGSMNSPVAAQRLGNLKSESSMMDISPYSTNVANMPIVPVPYHSIYSSHPNEPDRLGRMEEAVKSQLATMKRPDTSSHGTVDSADYLSTAHMEHAVNKKLHPLTYDALFNAVTDKPGGDYHKKYFLPQHPTDRPLSQLPGLIYFLCVPKSTKKPPQVGSIFRSYADAHYTSVDRENPVICKVKEWPNLRDPTTIWRMYHYYGGNKKRASRKRKRNDAHFSQDDDE